MRFQHQYWCIAFTCLLLQVALGWCLPAATRKENKGIGKRECQIRTYECLFFSQIYLMCIGNDVGEAKYLTVVPEQAHLEQTGRDRYTPASQKMPLEGLSNKVLHKILSLFLIGPFTVLADPLSIERHVEAGKGQLTHWDWQGPTKKHTDWN